MLPPPPPPPCSSARVPLPPPNPHLDLATGITVTPSRSIGSPNTAEARALAPIFSARRWTSSPPSLCSRSIALDSSTPAISSSLLLLLDLPAIGGRRRVGVARRV